MHQAGRNRGGWGGGTHQTGGSGDDKCIRRVEIEGGGVGVHIRLAGVGQTYQTGGSVKGGGGDKSDGWDGGGGSAHQTGTLNSDSALYTGEAELAVTGGRIN